MQRAQVAHDCGFQLAECSAEQQQGEDFVRFQGIAVKWFALLTLLWMLPDGAPRLGATSKHGCLPLRRASQYHFIYGDPLRWCSDNLVRWFKDSGRGHSENAGWLPSQVRRPP